jgi:hypothetical protein
MKIILITAILLLTSGCCSLFCKPIYIPIPVPPVKVKLEPNVPCDLTNDQTSDSEVVRAMLKCIAMKNGYIKDMKTRLGDYIQ